MFRKTFKTIIFTLFILGAYPVQGLLAAQYNIKLAVLAPKGSTWVKMMEDLNKELQAKSNGKLALNIIAGGVAGDEQSVLRKIKIGQIDAAAFTGVGLGEIVPSVRVLELPMLFNSYREVDHVKNKLKPEFEKQFAAKGYELLGWAEAGFVNIYSNKAIKSKADLSGVKMWLWEGDDLGKAMYEALGVTPVPLSLPDVLTSLQTNLIDGVYAPPLGMIALQWYTKVKYLTNVNLANSTGAILISKRKYSKLPPDMQKLLKETTAKYSDKLVQQIRTENQQAQSTLKRRGIELIEVDGPAKQELVTISQSVWPKMVGKLYSQDLLNRVQGYIKEVR